MYNVYVLLNETSKKIYIGQTDDLEKRLKIHNERTFDKRAYTAINKGVWVVVYKGSFETRKEAMERERELKTSRGRSFIRDIVLGP